MRFQRIIIGLDFSDAAIAAAKWMSQCAPNAELTLVHAIEPPDRPRFARTALPAPDVVEHAARDFAETRLHELSTVLSAGHLRLEIRVGKPADVVPALAREIGADLVVIGPHGDRPHTAKFLGSTADRIVRLSPVSVLVATNPGSTPPRNMLVPVDDASITPTLLECVRDLSEAYDADVTLLHALSNAAYSHLASMSYATAGDDENAHREIRAELENEARRWLEELARTGLNRERVRATVTHGNAGDATVEMANTMGADLIVLGRRGSGLVAPALLGSTVGTVLHGARCPVLVITDNPDSSEPSS